MKLLHISDLHIGKKINGFSLIEDQRHILNQILITVKDYNVDGVLIAGDIYDMSIPSIEAINLFSSFLSEIHSYNVACYIVTGNHDNISRLTFGSEIMARENIYFAPKYSGKFIPIELKENICIWLLPFIRPFDIREYYPDVSYCSYEEMMQKIIGTAEINKNKINILVAHQFVTNNGISPLRCDSETLSLGTLDNIDVSNFIDFDYVALGHIHRPQSLGKKECRYGGSPLKYSFSEKNDKKSMVLLNIEKENIDIELIPYQPIRDMKEFVGTIEELIKLPICEDYVRVVLKDENFVKDVKQKLENVFPNVMEIVYDNTFTKNNNEIKLIKNVKTQSPMELFNNFYKQQNNVELDDEKSKIVLNIFQELDLEDR